MSTSQPDFKWLHNGEGGMTNRIKVICPSCQRTARRSRRIRPYGSADLCRPCYLREKQRAKYRSLSLEAIREERV